MINRLMHIIFSLPGKWRIIIAYPLMVVSFIISFSGMAVAFQKDTTCPETSVFLVVQGIGGTEVPGVVCMETGYLSVSDVFDYLKLRNNFSTTADTLSGTFITEDARFIIDNAHHRITFQGRVFELQKGDLMGIGHSLYMQTDLFGRIFGLECTFNYRSLSVKMHTKQELPAIREMRLETMRRNISRLKGEMKADTVIGRSYPFFHFGMADWSVIATQRSAGIKDTRLNLSLGAIVAGGETNVSLNYNNYASRQQPLTHDSGFNYIKPFDEKLQFYRWRFVNNSRPWLRQAIAGKIFAPSVSSIYAPIVGVQFTNTPSTFRRSFGTYTLSNFTEPGWSVELYVNNELVDFKKADASGFFTFEVPLVYGNSLVKLRFYGPWGEERYHEENISIPFNFLPSREFEYTASAGVVEDSSNSKFGRISMNYGAGRHVTLGGGFEYLSSIPTGGNMPFLNASIRITPNLLFSGDYTYGVRARGIMTYRLPSNLLFEVNYARYKRGQKAINFNFLEERKLIVSKPFRGKIMTVFSRLTLNQIILPGAKYGTAEWLMSGSVKGVGTNLTTYAIVTDQSGPYIYSNLSLAFRLPKQIIITPQLQYEYNKSKVMAVKAEMGKYLFRRGYMNISYERNYKSDFTNVGIGIRFDFSFSQIGFSAWRSNNENILVESVRGGLSYGGLAGNLRINNRNNVGLGGIVLQAFLDRNNNGRRDKGEPKVEGLQISVNGGRILHNRRDTSISIMELEPYTNYFVDLKRSSFENIAWRAKNTVFSIAIDPNRIKLVEVPVIVMGEVSGTVYVKDNNDKKGIGRISVCVYRSDNSLVANMLTEPDGFFNYLGLAPGSYTLRIDPKQLQKIGLVSYPEVISFEIKDSREGDLAAGLEFFLQPVSESGKYTK